MVQGRVEVLSFKMLLNDVKVQSILKDVEHADDVWVSRVHKNLKLVDEKVVQYWLLAQQVFLKNLEC